MFTMRPERTTQCDDADEWDTLPPMFGNLAAKLHGILIAMKSCNLPPEDIIPAKRRLITEFNELKQEIALTKNSMNAIKQDLARAKIVIAELRAFNESIETLSPLLPAACEGENVTSAPLEVSKKAAIPAIAPFQQKEWCSVPGYLKNCMNLQQVNNFIDAFNRQLIIKYTFLKKNRSTLNRTEKATYLTYKSLENADTKGLYFLVANDLKAARISARSINTMSGILRHGRRIRELRTGALVRYVVRTGDE